MRSEWNAEPVIRIRLHRRVSLAVLVVDDFTGRPVATPDVVVTAAGLPGRPVRKKDGYYLFLDSPLPVLDVTVRAWAYHPAFVRVELESLSPLRPVVKLRLTPNRNYGIPNETTCLEGTAPAGTDIRVLCENDPRPLRLLYDYETAGPLNGRLLQLYDPAASDPEGREFALFRKGESEPECFTVRKTAEDCEGGCVLAEPLARACKKAGATVLPAAAVRAEDDGRFFLPLRTLPVKPYRCRVLWRPPQGEWRQRTLEAEPGRVTRLDLSGEC
jgi:hypothetical protein